MVQTTALVVFSSWALGGMREWSQPWILAIALLGLLLVAWRYRETGQIGRRPFLPALLWAGFVGLALANPSHAPLPGGGWAPRPDWIPWLPTTPDARHTVAAGRTWLAALLQGAVVLSVLQTPRAARLIWGAMALNGFVLAATGAFFRFAGHERVLGFVEPPERSYFFGPFFYKNHWAAYGAVTAIAAFAIALRKWPAALSGHPPARGQALLLTGAGLLTAITLPLPGSRSGALLAAVVVAAFLGWLAAITWRRLAHRGARRGRLLAAAALVVAIVLAYGARAYAPRAAADLQRTRVQLARGLDAEALDLRLPVSRDTWRMAQARPWFGWGPGSYEIVFPVFQGSYLRRPDGRPSARFEFAHNDWLQVLAETGWVGAALLLVPAGMAAVGGWRRAGPIGRWALAGCALLAAYAWIDFPFHNPAMLVAWTILLTSAGRFDPRHAPPA